MSSCLTSPKKRLSPSAISALLAKEVLVIRSETMNKYALSVRITKVIPVHYERFVQLCVFDLYRAETWEFTVSNY
jgi:hypothetical protein